ncbi:MAG: hypothetical protein QW356_08425, partial [Candidatus Hadarchaeales archaeon]
SGKTMITWTGPSEAPKGRSRAFHPALAEFAAGEGMMWSGVLAMALVSCLGSVPRTFDAFLPQFALFCLLEYAGYRILLTGFKDRPQLANSLIYSGLLMIVCMAAVVLKIWDVGFGLKSTEFWFRFIYLASLLYLGIRLVEKGRIKFVRKGLIES